MVVPVPFRNDGRILHARIAAQEVNLRAGHDRPANRQKRVFGELDLEEERKRLEHVLVLKEEESGVLPLEQTEVEECTDGGLA